MSITANGKAAVNVQLTYSDGTVWAGWASPTVTGSTNWNTTTWISGNTAPSYPTLSLGKSIDLTYSAESMNWRFDNVATPNILTQDEYGALNMGTYGGTASQNVLGAEYLVLHLTVTNKGASSIDPVDFASFGTWSSVSPGGQQTDLQSYDESVQQPVVNGDAYGSPIQPGTSGVVTMLFLVPRNGSLALDSQGDGSTVLQINY